MPDRPVEPTDADGPLFREVHRRADAVDNAEAPAARRKAWARFVPAALAAFAEGILRDRLMVGAAVLSVIVAIFGAPAANNAPAAAGSIAAGVLGTVLILLAWLRHWSFGRQWAVIVSVLALQVAVMILFW